MSITFSHLQGDAMSVPLATVKIGQFSESPHLAIARALDMGAQHGIDWVTERVASSPAQFESLRTGELDLAITSPDNVLMYATTAGNPLKEQLDLQILRPIDRGLGLALYTSASVKSPADFSGMSLGVDVMSSGFALLLLQMLQSIGVNRADLVFEAIGATPKRLGAIREGLVVGSILNAETAVAAEEAGLVKWATSTEIDSNYLGTVLANISGVQSETTRSFLNMWEEVTQVIINSDSKHVKDLLEVYAPKLATDRYVEILKSPEFGVISGESISVDQLTVLAKIRERSGAYTPPEAELEKLAAHA